MTPLPAGLADAVRQIVAQHVHAVAPSRGEFEQLQQLVAARLQQLSAADRVVLAAVLTALHALRPGTWCNASEILAIAIAHPAPEAVALRLALADILRSPGPGKRLGQLLKRAAGVPIGGLYLLRVDPPHRRDSALFMVAGMSAA